jgi:hypothetical protein
MKINRDSVSSGELKQIRPIFYFDVILILISIEK